MQCKSPDTRIYDELTSLNAGLLRLMVWQESADAPAPPRLAPAISSQLRALTADELEFIARTPALLASFGAPAIGAGTDRIADATNAAASYASGDRWSHLTRLFTATLLTWLWKTDQCDQLVRMLCVGNPRSMPHVTVPMIESLAGDAAPRLCIRFARHPRFWPDLISAAQSGDPQLRALSRLAVIPLVLAEQGSA